MGKTFKKNRFDDDDDYDKDMKFKKRQDERKNKIKNNEKFDKVDDDDE